jgi:N-acetylneuraminic acid mutarotase
MFAPKMTLLLAVFVLAAAIPAGASDKRRSSSPQKEQALPDLPFGITSFGAALVDHQLYVCAGQRGAAHEYSIEGQSDQFLRLDLRAPKSWETVGTVPRGSGLAMVSYDGKIYRIGGFEARNKEGQKQDLHSVADFSRFDPKTGRWESISPLPKPRSSHDAVVVGSRVIVVGGWDLGGKEPTVWDDTALSADLSADHPTWEELPKPPFRRRAFALGECRDKVYVLGGMQEAGGITTTTYVLDLRARKWSAGPKLPGDGKLEGFGGAAATCAGQLFVSTYSGKIWRLAEDGQSWQDAGKLPRPRFFHRVLCVNNASLVVVGGASMEEGKDLSVELVPVSPARVTRR